jgi:DNA-binding response OmpR family regulator
VPRVLVVSADPESGEAIGTALARESFEVLRAESALEAVERAATAAPDALVVDTWLRDRSGFAVCRQLRESEATRELPILMLTPADSELDNVLAFEAGADDAVRRPFYPRELALRVRALLRRADGERGAAEPPLAHGPITLDQSRRSVLADGDSVALTEIEFALLALLLRRPSHVFTRDEILAEIWPDGAARTPRVVDTHVKGIRRKLGPAAWVLESLHGVGYRLAALPVRER